MFFSKLSATSVIFVVERNTVSVRYGFNGRIMQFIRIAGDDAERSKKYKRPLKVQKLQLFYLCFVCGFLISASVLESMKESGLFM